MIGRHVERTRRNTKFQSEKPGDYLKDSCSSEQGPEASSSKHGNEYLGSMKIGEFPDRMSDYQLFKQKESPGLMCA